LYTFSIFGLVGIKEKPIRPLAVEDLVTVIVAAFLDARLSNKTVSITGPEEILLSEAVRRVGEVIGRRPLYVPTPLAIQKVIARKVMAWLAERIMKIRLLSLAQLRILAEGIVEALPPLRCASRRLAADEAIHSGTNPKRTAGARRVRFARSALCVGGMRLRPLEAYVEGESRL
jgi:hypothetical protein